MLHNERAVRPRAAGTLRPNRAAWKRFTTPRLETLEERATPAITFQFNYAFNTSALFNNTAARAVLSQAGEILGAQLNDQLSAINPGGGNSWNAIVINPSTGQTVRLTNPSIAANTLLVYVGGQNYGGATLGVGGPGGWSASGSSAWFNTVMARGQPGALGAGTTDFGPWGGSLTFDTATNWYLGGTAGTPGAGQFDLLSVAIHELGHLLGVGTADSWDARVSAGRFQGAHSVASYGSGVPVDGSASHWASGVRSGGLAAAMAPTINAGTRKLFTPLDWASLRDIGWNSTPGAPPQSPTVVPTEPTSDLVGVYAGDTGGWSLRGSNPAVAAGQFNFGSAWSNVTGDWNNDGRDDVGLHDSTSGTWYLRTIGPGGAASIQVFQYGGANWQPIVGDWNGDGQTDIGAVDRSTMTWYLRHGIGAGNADAGVFRYGSANWIAVTGDWNGDGRTDIGAINRSNMFWYLRIGTGPGTANAGIFQYGAMGMQTLTGDWNGDGRTDVGAYSAVAGKWYLRNGLAANSPYNVVNDVAGTRAIAGDWDGDGRHDLGTYQAVTGAWQLRTSTGTTSFTFGPGAWIAVAGDWDGNGTVTVGLFDAGTATWMLRNSNSAGAPHYVFQFGTANGRPVVGDWDGDGTSGIGVLDPLTSTWNLRQTATSGDADAGSFVFGFGAWTPVAGDWDGDGQSGIGMFDPATRTWYLRNAATTGPVDTTFTFGLAGSMAVVGDWNGDGSDSIGAFLPGAAFWYLRNTNSAGGTDYTPFQFGSVNARPVVGDWNGPLASLVREGQRPPAGPCNCEFCRSLQAANAPSQAVPSERAALDEAFDNAATGARSGDESRSAAPMAASADDPVALGTATVSLNVIECAAPVKPAFAPPSMARGSSLRTSSVDVTDALDAIFLSWR